MSQGWAWQILGIAPTTETGPIRRAYADKLRALEIDRDAAQYAELRQARDWALDRARREAALTPQTGLDGNLLDGELNAPLGLTEPVALDPAPEARSEPWAYAAPRIDREAGPATPTVIPDPGGPAYAWPERGGTGQPVAIPTPEGQAFITPTLADSGELAGEPVMLVRDSDSRLHDLLYRNGEEDQTPLDPAELKAAQRHLAAILREAETGTVATHNGIEHWLAPTLAGAWPRCAPLLEPAEATFHWTRQAGQLGERQAVAFLNARLKGMRFENAVQDPGHPYHRAWNELSQPGRPPRWRWNRVERAQVQGLLEGIRKHYPELESRFDPQRVAGWEGGQSAAPSVKSAWSGARWWVIGAFVLIRVLAALGNGSSGSSSNLLESTSQIEALADQVAGAAFGPGKTNAWLQSLAPEMASNIRTHLRFDPSPDAADAAKVAYSLNVVRETLVDAGQEQSGPDFDRTMALKLGYLRAARKFSIGACLTYIRDGRIDPQVVLGDELRAREQGVFSALIASGHTGSPRSGTHQASVPGEMIDRVIKATGLSEQRVRKALHNEGSDADRCAVHTELLAQALVWKGPERTAILKVL